MPIHPRFSVHRPPPWWPENEAWPPQRGALRGKPFFRRLGCLFGLFNLLGLAFFLFIIVFTAHLFGLIHLAPRVIELTLPVGVGVFGLVVIALVAVGMALRRIFNPLDSLLEAADRVAAGDYTVRVAEKGEAAALYK